MSVLDLKPSDATTVRIRPTTGWAALNLAEVWRFRDLLLTLGSREIKVRYKQTVLGVAWVTLQPLIAAGIFSFIFGKIANLQAPGGIPYFLFVFAGMVAWNLFSRSLQASTGSMVANAGLVSKIYFPRLILPFSTLMVVSVDFLVALVLMFVLVGAYWGGFSWALLLMPVPLTILMLMAMGIGLIATSLSVKYRDIGHIMPVFSQFLLYGSPVAFPLEKVREAIPEYYHWYYIVDPVVAPLEAFRWTVFGEGDPAWPFLAYSAAVAVGIFFAGAVVFKRMERTFADVI